MQIVTNRDCIVVWYNKKKDSYYYKVVFNLDNYFVGKKNQYNHEVVLVIWLYKDIIKKDSFLKKVISKLICFLQYINRKL